MVEAFRFQAKKLFIVAEWFVLPANRGRIEAALYRVAKAESGNQNHQEFRMQDKARHEETIPRFYRNQRIYDPSPYRSGSLSPKDFNSFVSKGGETCQKI
jgi:hypothetical protein